ncbi:oxidoreductase [Secundilactobacillus paracollinoides]|uniref:NADP-dependent oxidoreductase n=1 Tax=Secundilactobacillus paracollinoides TaxID=240427 RepID=UPI0006F18280|nr:NADP-dependent oxidoreductase [Secundilactobacillus paracollinoides]ANZ64954.1 oxidoreductase [Secundilactobacillus paracollinoides]KRL79896.1 oxidoreductase zinc-binding protein [Secundilactobacillus paracollinoides DSM 15502 = JCM 11969]
MKTAQITRYSKQIHAEVIETTKPEIQANEVLVQVKEAAVNPLDLMNIDGSVKLIQNYRMPLVLGNELSGVIEAVGSQVTGFEVGDAIYTRLPVPKIGAFAEYVAVSADAIWHLPSNLNFKTGAAAALTGLTAYQALHEELQMKAGQTLFIPGGSGSFGQMAIPLAKAMGLTVIVSGNAQAKSRTLAIGADQYLDYRTENYWDVLSKVDAVIDTLGTSAIAHELAIIKPGGRLLSLKAGPNKQFAVNYGSPKWKQWLFGLAGAKLDRQARQAGVTYGFMFVRASGEQLRDITTVIEANDIVPAVDPKAFSLADVNEALRYVKDGHPQGKVLISF